MRKFDSFQVANRLKHANHWLQVLLFLGLVFSLNYLGMKHFLRFDLTEDHHYALSPETKAYLNEIDQPVRIIVTIPKNSQRQEEQILFRYLSELLNEYIYASRHNGEFLISSEYVDIYQDLTKAGTLSRDYGLDQVNSILVISGQRQRLIRASEILEFENLQPVAFKGETAITSAIMETTQESSPVLYFLRGHEESRPDDPSPQYGLTNLASELQVRNFTINSLDLTSLNRVPEDCSILIIADPKGPLLPSEVDKIRTYLTERAGQVIIWTRPSADLGLQPLLREWGIIIPENLRIIEPDAGYRDAGGTLLIRNFGEHPITQSLIDNQTFIVTGSAQPVFPVKPVPPDERLHQMPLFATSASSWAESTFASETNPTFDPNSDTPGPVPVAVAAERRASSQLGIRVPGGRLVVFGSPDLFSNQRVTSLGNVSLFFNTLNWMLERNSMLVIPPKPIDSYRFVISQDQFFKLGLAFLAIPGTIALFGIIIFWIRKP